VIISSQDIRGWTSLKMARDFDQRQKRISYILTANVYSKNLQKIWNKKARIHVGPNTSEEIFSVYIPEEFKVGVYFTELQLNDKQGNIISENFYWLAADDDFAFLSELPEVKLDAEINKEEDGKIIISKIRLMNTSNDLAFFVNPSIRKEKEGEEVRPCFWSDNYFSILPGKTKELTVEFQKSELVGEEAYLKLHGWNVVQQVIKMDR